MYCYVFVIVILCGLSRQENGIQEKPQNNHSDEIFQGPNNRSSQNDPLFIIQDQSNNQNGQRQTVLNGTGNSTTEMFNVDMKAIYMYVGIGVGVLILFAIQTTFLIIYFNKVKLRRVNEIANNLLTATNNEANDRARYSKQPIKMKTKKIETDDDTNQYECLADLQRPPTPPPLASLPRNPLPVTPSPTITSQKKETREENYIKNRGRMPLPHELPKPGKNMNSLPIRKKPKIPTPNEYKPMVTTLPSKFKSTKAAVPVMKPATAYNDPQINELMAKLKMRAQKNALLEESNLSPIQTNISGSTRPLQFKPKPALPPPVRQTHYEDAQNYDPRDSTSSDNEWTMETLAPYNIYNV